MKQLLETDQWSDLAVRVLAIGYKDNLAWYYLGRAAEGLGHVEAARTYYLRGQASPTKCDALFNYCEGVVFPRAFHSRLANLPGSQQTPREPAGVPTGGVGSTVPVPPPLPPPAGVQSAAGSGFLLRNTNFLLTNYHVVENRKQVRLSFPNGDSFPGRVIATDPAHDLALVEAVGRPLSVGGLALAMDAPIRAGEPVHAIGYPVAGDLSRKPSIVSGQISSAVGLRDEISQFRTTAPINPGNSGGPVLNQYGQVIGIAAAGLVRADVEAIRFAIKASAAAVILQQVSVATPFNIAVTPTGPIPADAIFEQSAPYVVLIEAK